MSKELADKTSELLKRALELPPGARAALAGSLLESLDDTIEASAEEAWNEEIARRLRELDGGEVKPIPWGEARPKSRQRSMAAKFSGQTANEFA